MPNPADKLFKIMQHSGTDTISELIGLTVKSVNPLELSNGDKLILTEDFIAFDNFIDKSKIQVGDKFSAISLNADQMYYINDIISSAVELDIYKQELIDLKSRVSSLENRMTVAETHIGALEDAIVSLDERVTALENRY